MGKLKYHTRLVTIITGPSASASPVLKGKEWEACTVGVIVRLGVGASTPQVGFQKSELEHVVCWGIDKNSRLGESLNCKKSAHKREFNLVARTVPM